jgi:2,3-bisphosphoglycerate-independent phosphoglycerate mutase
VGIMLLFIDGVGLGAEDPQVNPLVAARMDHLRGLLGGRPLVRAALPLTGPPTWAAVTDPTLGIPGLPQSATGQTAILTGVNAAEAIGRHLNAYPTPNLKRILHEHSIFKRLKEAGRNPTFLNAYGPQFFQWMEAGFPAIADRRRRPSSSTVAVLASGLPFRSFDHLERGEAVYHDIDHHTMPARGYTQMAPVDPVEAGRRAAAVANTHDFTLYEHFLTDLAGHTMDMAAAVAVLERLDRFLGGLVAHLSDETTLVITSDHGNIEDLSVKTHTLNPVATICRGPLAAAVAGRADSLIEITPAILEALGVPAGAA